MLNRLDVTKRICSELISALYMIISVIPGYFLIGSLFEQIVITMLFTFVFVYFADRFDVNPVVLGHSISIMTVFWVALAVFLQIKIHIYYNDKSLLWYHLFYYDKIALLYVASATVFLFYIVKLFFNSEDKQFAHDYNRFVKVTGVTMIIYYSLTLIYCFILCRVPGISRAQANLIPFNVIKNTFFTGRLDYELIFLFFGNIAIFMPLGIILAAFLKNKHKWFLVILPIFLSSLIEIGQYVFKIGHCDIDDVILNVLGFYFGVFFKTVLDKLIFRLSKGKIKSVFGF